MADAHEVRFPRDGGCFGCPPSNERGMQLAFFRRGDRIGTRYAVPEPLLLAEVDQPSP